MLYLNGDGVERDERQARSWFQKAADQDFVPAKDALKNL
jgi:TPR repeat protein